jgi:hypothetical protein
MANIKVSLELDDKDYVNKLKAAEAQTRALGTAGATAGAAGAAGIGTMAVAMRGLQAATMAAMTTMAPLLAAVATFQTISAVFTLGDDISDLAAGSGIAAEKIIALRGALAASGGSADSAAMLITKLTNNLQEATEMGSTAQKNLMKLGFTLEDIKTMTPEQALQKTLEGLAAIQDPVERNAMAFDLLGRKAANVDWNNVAESTKVITEDQKRQADAAMEVGEAFDVIGAAFNSAMLSLMDLLAPFADLISDLGQSAELGGVASGIFTILRGVFAGVAVIAYDLAQRIAGLIDGVYSLGKAGVQVLSGDLSGASSTYSAMLGRQEARLKKTGDFAVKQWNRIVNPPARKSYSDEDNSANRTLTSKPKAGRTGPSAADREREREAELRRDELDKAEDLTLEIGNQTDALKRKFAVQMANVGLSDQERQLNEQLAQVEEKRLADIVKIQQLQRLTAEERAAEEAKINEAYAAQTAEIKRGNAALNMRNFGQGQATLFAATDLDNMREYNQQRARMRAEQQASRAATEPERQAIMEMLDLRQRYADQIDRLNQQRMNSTDAAEKEQLRIRAANLEALQTLEIGYLQKTQAERKKIFDQSRTFAEGLDQAMIKFAESVGDNAAYAGRLFDTVTQGFTDSIMNFVETGKLSFKDLFKTLMAEIIKMQINKFFVSIFGKGGAFGAEGFAGLFAEGGRIPGGKYGIVGERGPELVSGPANVIGTDQTADMMGGGGTTIVNYNIQAVDSRSFKDLVASDPAFIYNVTRAGARRVAR